MLFVCYEVQLSLRTTMNLMVNRYGYTQECNEINNLFPETSSSDSLTYYNQWAALD